MLRPDAVFTRAPMARPSMPLRIDASSVGDWPRGSPQSARAGRAPNSDRLMVEKVTWHDGRLLVTGWCTGSLHVQILQGDLPLSLAVVRQHRADVVEALSLSDPGVAAGFDISANAPEPGPWLLHWQPDSQSGTPPAPLVGWLHPDTESAPPSSPAPVGPGHTARPSSSTLATHGTHARPAGVLEQAIYHPAARALLVTGWATTLHWQSLSVSTDQGDTIPLTQSFCLFRQDVFDALRQEGPLSGAAHGFVACVVASSALRPQQIALQWLPLAASSAPAALNASAQETATPPPRPAPMVLTRVPVTEGSNDPWQVLQTLQQSSTPQALLCERLRLAEGAVIDALVRVEHAHWSLWPVTARRLGADTTRGHPQVSIIVATSGPLPRLEHQMALFARDAALCAQAQFILVLDSPSLAQNMDVIADELHRLHPGLDVTWVWGTHPRGVAGAYNLGFSFADAAVCIFMTTQVFPEESGWAATLLSALEEDASAAAVVPQRRGWDRSLSHPVLRMAWQAAWQTWLPAPWCPGLDAALDPVGDGQPIQAATATCVAVRSADLLAVQGWDTGYLTDDFTGPDLCAKLGDAGRQVLYVHSTHLIELPRPSRVEADPPHRPHSVPLTPALRQAVTLYDATRYQLRWPHAHTPAHTAAQLVPSPP